MLQRPGAPPAGQHRWDAGPPGERRRMGRVRRPMVQGRIGCLCISNGTHRPRRSATCSSWTSPRADGPRLTDFDQTKKFGWWFTFPSFSSDGGSVLYQLPRSNSKDAAWDLWSVPVGGGTPALVMPQRRVGRLRTRRHGARVALSGERGHLPRWEALGHRRVRRAARDAVRRRRGPLVAEMVPGCDAARLHEERIGLRADRRDRSRSRRSPRAAVTRSGSTTTR